MRRPHVPVGGAHPSASEPALRDGGRADKKARKRSEPKMHRQPTPPPPPFRRQDVHVIIDFEVTIQVPHYVPAEIALCAFSAERGVIGTFHAFLKPAEFVSKESMVAARHVERLITGIPLLGAPNARSDYLRLLVEMEAFLNQHNAVALYAKDGAVENDCLRYIVDKARRRTTSTLLSGPVREYHDLMGVSLNRTLDKETTNQIFRLQTGIECEFHAKRNEAPANRPPEDPDAPPPTRKTRKLGPGHFHCALKDVCGVSAALLHCFNNQADVLQMDDGYVRARAEAAERHRLEKELAKERARAAIVRLRRNTFKQWPLLHVTGTNFFISTVPRSDEHASALAAHGVGLLVCVGGAVVDLALLDDADLGLILLRPDIQSAKTQPAKKQPAKKQHGSGNNSESAAGLANRTMLEQALADGETVCLCGPTLSDVKRLYRAWRRANGIDPQQLHQEVKIFFGGASKE